MAEDCANMWDEKKIKCFGETNIYEMSVNVVIMAFQNTPPTIVTATLSSPRKIVPLNQNNSLSFMSDPLILCSRAQPKRETESKELSVHSRK